ncbi:TRAF3-interacting protein 1-like [Hippoglossus stenolepis]|uniref:TRAF3-interacting protein 1-like n=1 Tax=Hippoglossus stenolepis TaxID=195615 RepID=UPI001FAED62F|nr:TRAF3-interacting protein 1-like [Hippoglossus stenolepis]
MRQVSQVIIKKTPLPQNRLNRPPFRYLHDIFTEVIRTTGFMKGLYEENEMNPDNVKDKQSKIAFLQKAIDVVMLVSGEALLAKPAHIVAGHQPERTNELLQAIAKCCLNKMPSDDAVKRVLGEKKVDMRTKASTSRSQGNVKMNEKREECECHMSREESKKITKHSCRGNHLPDEPKEQQRRLRDVEKKHHRDRKCSDKHLHSVQDHGKECDKYKSQDQVRDKDRGRDKDRQNLKDRERDREREKDKERDKEQEKSREIDSHRVMERDKKKQRDKERERPKEGEEGNKTVNRKSKAKVSAETEGWGKIAKPVPASENPGRKPRPSSAEGQRQRCKIRGQDESVSEGNRDAQLTQSSGPLGNRDTVGSLVPSDMAPSRACRETPRFKRQKNYPGMTSAGRLLSAINPVPIIMDREKLSEDEEVEDKQFVKEAAVHPPPHAPDIKVDLSPSCPESKEQNWVSEAAWKKEEDAVTREVEWLHSSIQTVSCSFLPLGKIMDNILEDTDAMLAEHHTWQQVNKEHAQALLEEQRTTDPTLDPLKAELAELEQLTADELDKICAVKSNILKNEEKIQKLVTGINVSYST